MHFVLPGSVPAGLVIDSMAELADEVVGSTQLTGCAMEAGEHILLKGAVD